MDPDEAALHLYKLEYEKGAERYENIYRSMWSIFSYLTAVTAGLLAFGSDRINPHALIWIAAIPLLFWFWTTYLPLDRYGNRAVDRLVEIERLLNNRFHTQVDHFTNFRSLRRGGVRNYIKRARFAIIVFFLALHLVAFYDAYVFHKSGQLLFREKPAAATAVGQAQ